MRTIIVSGRLAANAEVKTTNGGNAYVEFRIGNNEYSKNNQEETYWFRVVSFNTNHTKLVQYLTKGKSVEVIGQLSANAYVGHDNKMRVGFDIRASEIMFDNNFGSKDQQQQGTANTTVTANPTTSTAPQTAASAPLRNPSTATVATSTATTSSSPNPQPTETAKAAPAPTATEDDTDDLPF